MNKTVLFYIGSRKWRAERVIGLIQRLVSFATLVGIMKLASWSMWWLAVLIPGFIILWFLDKHIFYPGEAQASLRENPEWIQLTNKLERRDEGGKRP